MPNFLTGETEEATDVQIPLQRDIATNKNIEDIANIQTGAEEFAAQVRQSYSPVVAFNAISTMFHEPEVGFDITSDKAKEITAGLTAKEYENISDSKSLRELRDRSSQIRQEVKDDRTLSHVGLGQGLVTGFGLMAVDPLSIGAMGFTSRMLTGLGTTAFRRVAINAGAVGAEVGAVEAMYRSTGSQNYETVPVAVGVGMAFGAGASSLGEYIGKMSSGAKERFTRDLENIPMNDDMMTGPAQGSLKEFYQDAVTRPVREPKRASEFDDFAGQSAGEQPSLFKPQAKTWKAGTFEVDRFQSKSHGPDSKPGTIKNNVRDSIMHYVKKSKTKNVTNLEKSARVIGNRIGAKVSALSHGRYDASDIIGDVIDDSLQTGNRSNATKYAQSNNGGLSHGERWTENTVPDGIFVTEVQATRIANGKGTVKDFEALEKAVDSRLGEYEASYNKYGKEARESSKWQYEKYDEVTGEPEVGQFKQKENIQLEAKWEVAPDYKQPKNKLSIKENFEQMYKKRLSDEKVFGKGVDEGKLSAAEKDMVSDAKAKDIAIERSVASAWLGKIAGSRLTGSSLNILLGRAADGKIDKRIALLLSKFDTLIYRVKGAEGERLEAGLTTSDIREELGQIYGLNQAYKHQAYMEYKQWFAKQDDLELKDMNTMEEFDARITENYSKVYAEFEERLADNIRTIKKDLVEYNKIEMEVRTKLESTKPVEVEVKGDDGKANLSTEDIIADERYRNAIEEGPEAKQAYIDDAIDAEVNRRAEMDIDPIQIMKENPKIQSFDRTAMEADIEFYKYHSQRAKSNGLDSQNTWSTKMYNRQMVDNEAIMAAGADVATPIFMSAIRRHPKYQHAIEEIADKMRGRYERLSGADKIPGYKKHAEDIQVMTKELNGIRTRDGAKMGFSKEYNALRTRLNMRLSKFRHLDGANELESELLHAMNTPDRIAKELVKKAQTVTNLKDATFDIKWGGPGFLQRKSLSLDMRTQGLSDLLDMGSQKNLAAYDYQIRGEHATKEIFGTTDREVFLAEQGRTMHIDKESAEMLGNMFEVVKGDKQIPNDPNAWSETLARAANQFTFLTAGGGFLKYAISELGVSAAKHGFRNTVREIPEAFGMMKKLYQQAESGKIDFSDPDVRELMAFGEVFELYSRRMKSVFSDLSHADGLASSNAKGNMFSKADKKLNGWQQEYYKWTGLEGATMITKMVAARAFMRRMGDVVVSGKVDGVDLGRWGFDDVEIPKLRKELERAGYDGKNKVDFGFDKWEDQAFAVKMRRVITRASRDTILRNEDIRKPLWMVDGKTFPIFKTTKLFMSFQFMSTERLLLAGMSDSPAKVAGGAVATAAVLSMAYITAELMDVAMGNKTAEDAILPWNENAGKYFRQLAVMNSYSGTWGMAGQTFGFRNWDGGIANGKFGSAYRDVSMFFGGAPVSKAFNTLVPIGTESWKALQGEDEPSGKRFGNAIKGALPANNHWLLNGANKALTREIFGEE